MSTTTAASNSSSATSAAVAYATQLAQAAALKRSLSNLGTAVQNGDMTSANTILTALIQANPQWAASASSGSSSTSQDPINLDFQTLATAISNDQPDAAKSAWATVQTDLAKDGVTNINSGAADTAQLLAQSKATIDQEVLSSVFGVSGSSGQSSVAELLGGASSSGAPDPLTSLLTNWATYEAGGNLTQVPTPGSTGTNLNTVA
jgi:hypothetical protein